MSPPTHDEPFFHIRLPLLKRGKLHTDQQSTTGSSSLDSTTSSNSLSLETDIECGPSVDLSNECKKYYAGLENGMTWSVSLFFFSLYLCLFSIHSLSFCLQPLRPIFIAANQKVLMMISKQPLVQVH